MQKCFISVIGCVLEKVNFVNFAMLLNKECIFKHTLKKTFYSFMLVCVSIFYSSSAHAEKDINKELITVYHQDIRDLNPHLYSGEMYAQGIIYDGLIDMTSTGFKGALAESWEISPDGKTYTFYIRDNVTFSDGEPADAYALKANFDAIIENKNRHLWIKMMQLLESVEAHDAKTLEITLSEPYYPMLIELSVVRPFAFISPKAMKNGSTMKGVNAYIGTGPYILTDFVTNEYATFKRNENYWGEKPHLEKIVVKVVPHEHTRVLALEKGEIDLIFGQSMLDVHLLVEQASNPKFDIAFSDPVSTRHILFNSTNPILKDEKIRQAIAHATNKQEISEGIFYSYEVPADVFFPKTIMYADIPLTPFEYNTQKAEEIFKEAGWEKNSNGILHKDGKAFEIGLLYNNNRVIERTIAEYLQAEYLRLGIKLNIHGEEEQSYMDTMKTASFDMALNVTWGVPYDPQSFLAGMTAPVHGDYNAQLGLENKTEIDKAINEIIMSVDEKERQDLFKYVLTELHESAVYLPLTYTLNKALYPSKLQGIQFAPSQYEIPFNLFYFKE